MPVIEPSGDNEKNYLKLVEMIQEGMRFNCRDYNEAYIKRRLNARMLANNITQDNFGAYVSILNNHPEEVRKLCDALTINVTQFFRDTKLWEALEKDVFPKLIAEKISTQKKTLTLWSCGCSSGEEPYSLAMLLTDLIGNQPITLKIIATDIDEDSLKKSHNGVYGLNAIKTAPRKYVDRYFHRMPDQKGNEERYELDISIRSLVQVLYHNAITQSAPGINFDMIFCRNVIIYFTQETKNKLMDTFHGALAEHGWLVIGKSEVLFTAKAPNKFYIYNVAESIYRKDRRSFAPGSR